MRMFERIVDYCIDKASVYDKMLFLAYVQSNVYSYRTRELYESKKTIIDKMSVNDYFDLDGVEINIPLNRPVYGLRKK